MQLTRSPAQLVFPSTAPALLPILIFCIVTQNVPPSISKHHTSSSRLASPSELLPPEKHPGWYFVAPGDFKALCDAPWLGELAKWLDHYSHFTDYLGRDTERLSDIHN